MTLITISRKAALAALILFPSAIAVLGQTGADVNAFRKVVDDARSSSESNERLAKMQLEDVRLSGQGLSSILARLALSYDIPIGLQVAMNSDYPTEQKLEFKKGSLTELLTQFASEHKEYSWEISDGVVYVFPKQGYRDPLLEDLLSVEIGTFSLGKGALVWDVETKLLKTPEFEAVVNAYGLSSLGWYASGFYFPQLGRNYTLDVSNATVQSILNRIVKESPTAKFWSTSRNSAQHTLSISFAANQEDTPKNLRPMPPDLTDLMRDLEP